MVSATANMLTVIAQTGAIVDSVSISGRWAIVTVIMGANEKATESHLLWSAILVASGCIILGKDGELAFASANYSLTLALYIYIYKCLWFLVSVMSSHVPSFSVLRSVDLNLIKADGSLGSSVLDPVLSQAACRLRQTVDDRWMLIHVTPGRCAIQVDALICGCSLQSTVVCIFHLLPRPDLHRYCW